jgi:hypothetical protein
MAGCLGGEALLERREEPPFLGSWPLIASLALGQRREMVRGRASQIASLTSTISSTWATKLL